MKIHVQAAGFIQQEQFLRSTEYKSPVSVKYRGFFGKACQIVVYFWSIRL